MLAAFPEKSYKATPRAHGFSLCVRRRSGGGPEETDVAEADVTDSGVPGGAAGEVEEDGRETAVAVGPEAAAAARAPAGAGIGDAEADGVTPPDAPTRRVGGGGGGSRRDARAGDAPGAVGAEGTLARGEATRDRRAGEVG